MAPSSASHVFISYSRRDSDVMRRIVKYLRGQGIKAWVDNEKLIPGTPIWEEEIEKAIKTASAVIVVMSPDSKNSEWVRREISLADQNRKRIFPVLVRGDEDSAITLRLITRQYVDMRQKEKLGLNSLSIALGIYLDELKEQEPIEKLSQVKTEPDNTEGRSTEKIIHKPVKGHSARFYYIWWRALIKPTEANYRSMAENPYISKITAFWWTFLAGIIFTNILVFTNFAPLAVAEMLLPIPEDLTLFTPAEAQWLVELNKLDPSKAATTALQLKKDKLKFRIELAINMAKQQDFSVLDLIIASLIISLIFVALINFHAYITDKVAKSRGGQGNFIKLIYILSAFTAPTLIISAWIASVLVTDWMLLRLGYSSIPIFAGIILLALIVLTTVAAKAVNNFSWGNAVISSSVLPVTIFLIITLPSLITYLDSIQVFGSGSISEFIKR